MTSKSRLMNVLRFAASLLIVFAARAVLPAAQQENVTASTDNQMMDGCLKCHNPVKLELQKKLKHGALDKGCLACHSDHLGISPLSKHQASAGHYLKAELPGVCMECHSRSAQDLEAAHRGQPFLQARCTGCHTPHASNVRKLLPEISHGPTGAKKCATCHVVREDGQLQLVAENMDTLCCDCHEDVKNRIDRSKSSHRLLALEHTSCLECHDPHATNQKFLLKKPDFELCSECHMDLLSGKRYVHVPVEVSCVLCHDPHASDIPKDLHAAGNQLCVGCHGSNAYKIVYATEPFPIFDGRLSLPPKIFDSIPFIRLTSAGTRGHPVSNHPVSAPATDEMGEVRCLSCHNPHASSTSSKMLNQDKKTICIVCHNS